MGGVVHINPITHEFYRNNEERQLAERLNDQQRGRLEGLIRRQRLEASEFRRGDTDEKGCYSTEIDRHLGDYEPHNVYATWVTGSKGDYLLVASNKKADAAFYDGEVKERGRAFGLGLEPLKALAEVKTAHLYLITAARGQQLNREEQGKKENLEAQIDRENSIAQLCGRKFFLSFDNKDVARAAQSLYKAKYPNVEIHYIKPGFLRIL